MVTVTELKVLAVREKIQTLESGDILALAQCEAFIDQQMVALPPEDWRDHRGNHGILSIDLTKILGAFPRAHSLARLVQDLYVAAGYIANGTVTTNDKNLICLGIR